MDKMLVAILEKMHQALAHLQDVLPAAAGMKGVLASIRADLDAMVAPDEPEAEEPEAEAKDMPPHVSDEPKPAPAKMPDEPAPAAMEAKAKKK